MLLDFYVQMEVGEGDGEGGVMTYSEKGETVSDMT
jgi:hypothetical protein